MKAFLLGVSTLALASSIAAAADLPARNLPVQQAPLPIFLWTGPFVGAHVGGTWGNTSVTETPVCGGPCGVVTYGHRDNGFVGGVQAGYNYQMGSIVLGVVGDIAGSNYDNKAVNPCCAPDYAGVKKKWEGSLRARLGFAIDRVMIYGTGGLAFGGFDYTYTNNGGTIPSTTISQTRTGWTVGGGVEFAFTYNWSVGVEYRYTDWGNVTNLPAAYNFNFNERHHDTENGVRMSVNYRF